ncbi:MAG: hypothetical protein GX144_12570 [Clostridiaceae bacterium]|jgi:hypothetical protein|nr:hypothetical protein [Clostridiaceae bacterium]
MLVIRSLSFGFSGKNDRFCATHVFIIMADMMNFNGEVMADYDKFNGKGMVVLRSFNGESGSIFLELNTNAS